MSRINMAGETAKPKWGKARFIIQDGDTGPTTITVSGRDRWALEVLMVAGIRGCTPIDTPGPRWSGYIFNLRQMGVDIETKTEAHAGPFGGTHARYVVRSNVSRDLTSEEGV